MVEFSLQRTCIMQRLQDSFYFIPLFGLLMPTTWRASFSYDLTMSRHKKNTPCGVHSGAWLPHVWLVLTLKSSTQTPIAFIFITSLKRKLRPGVCNLHIHFEGSYPQI